MRIQVFSSGSDGNSTLISSNNTNLLIDTGLTKKSIIENLELSNLNLDDINAILITHEHTDHTKGLFALLNKKTIDTYMSLGTYLAIKKSLSKSPSCLKQLELFKSLYESNVIKIIEREENSFLYEPFMIGDFYIQPLPLFHDAAETIGFIFTSELKRFVYITDTGYVHNELFSLISNADGYLLEANHDPEILLSSNRPYNLKMRILSDHGHLSNLDSISNKTYSLNFSIISLKSAISLLTKLTFSLQQFILLFISEFWFL